MVHASREFNTTTRRTTRHLLVGIFVLAVVCRAVAFFVVLFPEQRHIGDDTVHYECIARNLVAGRDYSSYENGAVPTVDRAPGYPFFLAAIYLVFGTSPFAVSAVQILIGGLTCVVVYHIGRQVAGSTVGLIASIVTALYPSLTLDAGVILTEPLFTFLVTLVVWSLGHAFERRSTLWYGITGCLTGLAALTRPTALWIPPFMLFGMLFLHRSCRRETITHFVALALSFLAILAPWGIRNYVQFGSPLLSGAYGGLAFWEGTIAPNEELMPDRDALRASVGGIEGITGLAVLEVNRRLYQAGWDNIKRSPGHYVRLWFQRLWEMYKRPHYIGIFGGTFGGQGLGQRLREFVSPPFEARNIEMLGDFMKRPELWYKIIVELLHFLLLGFGSAGVVISRQAWRKALPTAVVILALTVVPVCTYAISRYALPLMPLFAVFAAVAVQRVLCGHSIADVTVAKEGETE